MPQQSLTAMKVAFGARERATIIALTLSFLLVQITGVLIFSGVSRAVGTVSYDHSITTGFDGALGNPKAIAFAPNGSAFYVISHDDHKIHKYDSSETAVATWGDDGIDGGFSLPDDIAVDSNGNVFITIPNQVYKLDSDGNFITKWGSSGSSDGQFGDSELGIAVGVDDNVYVTDLANYRVQKFDNDGVFLTKWGSFGGGNGQFITVHGIDIDKAGNVYTSDINPSRIQKFTSNGTFISSATSTISSYEVTLDAANRLYVGGVLTNNIKKYAIDNSLITTWGSSGSSGGQFNFSSSSVSIEVSPSGQVYVADIGNNRVQVFNDNSFDLRLTTEDPTATGSTTATVWGKSSDIAGITAGSYSTQYGPDTNYGSETASYADWVAKSDETALSASGYSGTIDAANYGGVRDSTGAVYVTASSCRVLKFDSSGNYEHQLGSTCAGNATDKFGFFPDRITVDDNDNVYVGQPDSQYILKFDSDGNQLGYIDTAQFDGVRSMVVDKSSNLYVGTNSNPRVLKFNSAGSFVTQWGSSGSGDGQFSANSVWVAVDAAGNVYARNGSFGSNRIQRFTSDGTFVSKWTVGGGLQTIAIDDNNVVYAPTNTSNIDLYDTDGNNLGSISPEVPLNATGTIAGLDSTNGLLYLMENTSSGVLATYGRAAFTDLTGLTCGTTYHYRSKVVANGDTVYGGDQTLTTDACFTITTTNLPDGVVGVSYNQTIEANRPNVTFTLDSGDLPPGISLSPSGDVSGTPTTVGEYSFTVLADDNDSIDVDTQAYTITVTTSGTVDPEPEPEEEVTPEEPPADDEAPAEEQANPEEAAQEEAYVPTTTPPKNTPIKAPQASVTNQNSLFALVKQIPQPFALGFPWLLLLLALLIVASQYYQVHNERLATQAVQSALARQEQLVDEQNSFVALTTHYLHTPLTVMEGEIALMVKAGTLTQEQATKLKASLTSLSAEADKILAKEAESKPQEEKS